MISYEYFMDQLKPYELTLLLDSIGYAYRDSWEQTRLIMYSITQPNSKRKIKPKDILKFPWDTKAATVTKEDVERLRAKINANQNKLNNTK